MHYNLLNECMSCRKSITKPEIGMAATMFVGSDRYAMVVTEVMNDKTIRVEHLKDDDEENHLITGEDGVQKLDPRYIGNYVYADVHENKIMSYGTVYTYRKNKRWMPKGQDCWGTCSVHLGIVDSYRDPSF